VSQLTAEVGEGSVGTFPHRREILQTPHLVERVGDLPDLPEGRTGLVDETGQESPRAAEVPAVSLAGEQGRQRQRATQVDLVEPAGRVPGHGQIRLVDRAVEDLAEMPLGVGRSRHEQMFASRSTRPPVVCRRAGRPAGGGTTLAPRPPVGQRTMQEPGSEANTKAPAGREARAGLSEQTVESLAALLRALADPTRIRLIEILEDRGRATVSSLTASMPISQQSVSRQLGVLFQAGIVARRREGIWVQYELRDWSGPWILRQLAEGLAADRPQG
jgi:ArsR family transcriptional regulator